jgi:Tol biopolymer transport system component
MMKKLVFALLLLLPAAAVAQPYTRFGENKIVYDVFDWKIYHSTHFAIYFYTVEEASLGKVASMAESAYDELSRALNYQIPKPIPLIYYATHSEFEQTNTDLNFIPEGIGAFALPTRDRMVLPIDMPDEQLQKLIQHELTHVFQFELLFGGNVLRAVSAPVPQWFTEGMASYYGHDEDNHDRMFLRDAVVTDRVPAIARAGIEGYFAYRFGHAVFDFISAEWGPDAVRDFVYEYRTSLSANMEKVIGRTFGLSAEDFDVRFRRYLRQRYMEILATRGEPVDFGEHFQVGEEFGWQTSPAPFPSGDLIAAVATSTEKADVVIFSTRSKKLYKNLTKGYTTKYEYVIAQDVTTAARAGRDVGVSPDGNTVAAFVRRERGRDLVLFDVFSGNVVKEIPLKVDQPLSPVFSPDGTTIAFAALSGGRSNLFLYSIQNDTVTNLTQDQPFELAPAFSPDGTWIYYSAISGSFKKIFRVRVADPSVREQVTFGDWDDRDAALSPDGMRLFLSSDRDGGIYNIFSIDLKTGETWQHTNVVAGTFTPVVFTGEGDTEKLVFAAYYRGGFSLYIADSRKPFRKLPEVNPPAIPAPAFEATRYTPAIEVAVDPEKINKSPSHKLYIDQAQVAAGVNPDGTFLSDTSLAFSDMLGDRRLLFVFQSQSYFTNVFLTYFNMARRFQYGATLFNINEYYLVANPNGTISSRQIYRQTGGFLQGLYPLDRYHRLEGYVGFVSRQNNIPFTFQNPNGSFTLAPTSRTDNDPTFGVSFTGDTALYSEIGPLAGNRYSVSYSYTPDLKSGFQTIGTQPDGTPIVVKNGGTLTQDLLVDLRHYFRLFRRTLIAVRAYGAASKGNYPDIFAFGGFDTMPAYEYNSLFGNQIAYANIQLRFPLIDLIRMPFLQFGNIRGTLFLDVGSARTANIPGSAAPPPYRFWNGSNQDITINNVTYLPYQLVDGVADYGFGFALDLFGLEWHFDWARKWNFRNSQLCSTGTAGFPPGPCDGYQFSFFVGPSF